MLNLKSYFLLLLFLILSFVIVNGQVIPITDCTTSSEDLIPEAYEGLEEKMQELVKTGVPGLVIGVESKEGSFYAAAGFAQIEAEIPMRTCHLQYLQSISKTYLAVTVLQLYEEEEIELDTPVSKYLPQDLAQMIVDSDKMTVRMLLNHTSGLPEYNYLPSYVSVLLQDPAFPFVPMDYMRLIEGKNPDFEPGSKYSYRNSGYVLLALMMDHLTGDHAQNMQKKVFDPLQLNSTFYRNDPNYLKYPLLVNGYWDRFGNGIIENSTFLQINNVSKLVGDDGIVTTAHDALRFLKGLVEGELLQKQTLDEMETWVLDAKGEPAYGLGLDFTLLGGNRAFGHSGGGLGAGSQLYYFPDHDLYLFMAINLATVTDSPIHSKAEKLLNEIYDILLKK